MERYDRYKDSGVEWLGEIPAHWEVKRIKRLSMVKRGASPRPIADQKYFDINGEWAWVRIADVSASERYLVKTTQTLSELGSSLSVKMLPNTIFLSIAGTVGKPIITKIKCCIHDGFVYFPELKLNPEFIYYIFSTGQPYQGLGKLGTQLNLNTDTVGEIYLPIPKPDEINAIAHYLDRKTAEIDSLIAKKEQLLKLYEEEKTALINQAVTKGLPAEASAQAGINPNVPMKDSGIEWLGEIPAHWEVKKLKYVCELSSGNNLTSESIKENGNYPVYGGNGLRGFYSEYTHNGEYVLVGRQGALCGNINYAKNKFWATEHAIVASPITNYETVWLGELLRAMNLNQYSIAAAQPGLAVDIIKNLFIPFPSIKEQTAIVSYIEQETARINAKAEKTKKLIELLKEYKTALISEVVTGKVKIEPEKC